jgi:hypothetical protein
MFHFRCPVVPSKLVIGDSRVVLLAPSEAPTESDDTRTFAFEKLEPSATKTIIAIVTLIGPMHWANATRFGLVWFGGLFF